MRCGFTLIGHASTPPRLIAEYNSWRSQVQKVSDDFERFELAKRDFPDFNAGLRNDIKSFCHVGVGRAMCAAAELRKEFAVPSTAHWDDDDQRASANGWNPSLAVVRESVIKQLVDRGPLRPP